MPNRLRWIMLGLLVTVLGVSLTPLLAQDDETIITVAIQEWQSDVFNDELFDTFEEENPGVKVVTVTLDQQNSFFGYPPIMPPPEGSEMAQEQAENDTDPLEEYVENVRNYASSADVLPANSFQINNAVTRTGALLDMSPLLSADSDANLDDFYQPLLESFRWDGGTWGLPVVGRVNVIVYDRIAFDDAGLAYPDASWTVDDYVNAARELSTYNDEGEMTEFAMPPFGGSRLLYASLGDDLTDENSFPALPDFSNPELAPAVQTWASYQQEAREAMGGGGFRGGDAPINFGALYLLEGFGPPSEVERDWQAVMYPGDRSFVDVEGFAVSAGSNNPELAYRLVQYMTRSPEVTNRLFGDVTARRSMEGVEDENAPFTRPPRGEDVEAVVDEAVEKIVPASEVLFYNLLDMVIGSLGMTPDGEPADDITVEMVEEELETLEERAREVLTTIDESGQGTEIASVATPVPTPVLSSEEVALNFNIAGGFGGNQTSQWRDLADEFVAQDDQVGYIEIGTDFFGGGTFEEALAEQDCAFLGNNFINAIDEELLLSVDPFLAADPDYDESAMLGSVMEQVTINGQVKAIPLEIYPTVMWYNPERFEEANVPEPENGWNVSAFEDALRQLEPIMENDNEPYRSEQFGDTSVQLLAVAYGAENLVDFSTVPATYNYADEQNLNALRQVLDLAREGLMSYQRQVTDGGTFFGGGSGDNSQPLYDSVLRPGDFRLQNRSQDNGFEDPNRMVTFPTGNNVFPVSYTVSVGIISGSTEYPEACYRWMRWLSNQSGVLNGLPANANRLDTERIASTLGEDVAATYEEYTQVLQSPNAVEVTNIFGGSGAAVSSPSAGFSNYIARQWFSRAMDRYVLDDANLEEEFEQAQMFYNDYQSCAAGIEEPEDVNFDNVQVSEENQQAFEDYLNQFRTCAVEVDPSLEDIIQPIGGPAADSDDEDDD